MKKWIDRAWAKVTAYCLLVVLTAVLVLGGAAIVWLVTWNAYLDGGAEAEQSIYEQPCTNMAQTVISYLESVPAENGEMDITDPAFAEMFARVFEDASCAVSVVDGEGTELLRNYHPLNPLYAVSVDFTLNGVPLTVNAQLDEDHFQPGYSEAVARWLIRWRYAVLGLELLALAAWIFCLSFSLASAGHWRGYEGIHLTWFDKIPMDVWAALLLLGWGAMEFELRGLSPLWIAAGVLPGYLLLIAFAAQCKAGTVLRGSAVWWLLRGVGRFFRWVGYVLRRIPLVWKTALAVTAVLMINTVCAANYWDVEYLIVSLLVDLLAGLFLIYVAIGLRTLQKGGQALARGDYDQPVDTRWLFGDLRRHGEDLNAVQQGVQKAVDQRMRSERMRTELITNVSHDIKTPLTSIVNYVDLLKKENIENPQAAEYIGVLDRQSQRLRKLTEDLVEASKAATGAIPVTLTDTDVNVFLSQAVGEYRQRLAECGVEPVVTADETDPHIRADGKLLWRVLDNLLSNVCKYAMPGTRVYLSSQVVGETVLLTVKNVSRYPLNVSADELTERFVRGDASRSTEGSGLGLSIATGLTALQKGEFLLSVDGDLFKAQLRFPLYRA